MELTPPSSQSKRRASVPLMSPGYKAFAAGVTHAMLAQNVIEMFSSKKQKLMAPVTRSYGRSGKKTMKKYVKKATTLSKTKKAILSMAQTFNHPFTDAVLANNNTLCNSVYSYNLTAGLTQGTTVGARQGDQVYLVDLKMKGFVNSAAASNAYAFRIIVGWSGEEYNPATLLTTGLNATEFFLPVVSLSNTNGIINPKAFTVLADTTIDVNSQITATSDSQSFDATIPLYQKYAYQSGGSVYGKTKNLYVVVVSYVLAGTSGVTSTGGVAMGATLRFKNL